MRRMAVTTLVVGLMLWAVALPRSARGQQIASFETDLQGWGWAGNTRATTTRVQAGATDGSYAMQVDWPSDWRFIWGPGWAPGTPAGNLRYSSVVLLDVTVPAGGLRGPCWIGLVLLDQDGWRQFPENQFTTVPSAPGTYTIALDLARLRPAATEGAMMNLMIKGDWSGLPCRVYIDNIRLGSLYSATSIYASRPNDGAWSIAWHSNMIAALRNDASSWGDPATPAFFRALRAIEPADMSVTFFPSYGGLLDPGSVFGAAFANTYGAWLYNPVRIVGTPAGAPGGFASRPFTLWDRRLDTSSTDPGNNWGWVHTNEYLDYTWYRAGVYWGADRMRGTADDVVRDGSVPSQSSGWLPVDELYAISWGIGENQIGHEGPTPLDTLNNTVGYVAGLNGGERYFLNWETGFPIPGMPGRIIVKASAPIGDKSPVVSAGSDVTAECEGATTTVNLAGSVFDPDDAQLRVTWSEGATVRSNGKDLQAQLAFGTHVLTLSAEDPYGKAGSDTVIVRIVDTTPPTIGELEPVTTIETDPLGTTVTLDAPAVNDVCDPHPTLTNDAPARFQLGETIVTWTAADRSGNSAQRTQSISVIPGTPNNQLSNLIKLIDALVASGGVAPDIQASMMDKLIAAQTALAAGDTASVRGPLGALVNQVNAQTGKKISSSAAVAIINRVNSILSSLNR